VNKVDVSFIVPVYKAEQYLKKCTDSILNQQGFSLELILIDDESPDKSGAMCDEMAVNDSRVRVIHQKNAGQGAARNAGAKEAQGQWLFFVDDDDWLEDNLSDAAVPYLQDSSLDILVTAKRDVQPSKAIEGTINLSSGYHVFESKEALRALQLNMLNFFTVYDIPLHKIPFVTPWGKFIRNSYWQANNLNFIEGYGEDRPCMFKAYGCARKVVYLDRVFYNYRIHQSTMRKYLPNAIKRYQLSLGTIHSEVRQGFSEDKEFKSELAQTDVAYFSYCITQDYCHPDNPQSYAVRKKRYYDGLKRRPYANAFTHAITKGLPFRRRVLIWLIKTGLFWPVDLMFKADFYLRFKTQK